MQFPRLTWRLTNELCRVELIYVLFVRYLQKLRSRQLQKAAELAAAKAKVAIPVTVK